MAEQSKISLLDETTNKFNMWKIVDVSLDSHVKERKGKWNCSGASDMRSRSVIWFHLVQFRAKVNSNRLIINSRTKPNHLEFKLNQTE